jgi:hypothetical protein
MIWRLSDGPLDHQLSCLRLDKNKIRKLNRLLAGTPVVVKTSHFERIEHLCEIINSIYGPLQAAVVED